MQQFTVSQQDMDWTCVSPFCFALTKLNWYIECCAFECWKNERQLIRKILLSLSFSLFTLRTDSTRFWLNVRAWHSILSSLALAYMHNFWEEDNICLHDVTRRYGKWHAHVQGGPKSITPTKLSIRRSNRPVTSPTTVKSKSKSSRKKQTCKQFYPIPTKNFHVNPLRGSQSPEEQSRALSTKLVVLLGSHCL